MVKTNIIYICQQCGSVYHKWIGKCPSCNAWNSLEEEISKADATQRKTTKSKKNSLSVHSLSDHDQLHIRIKSGNPEFDRVCGGGMVSGGVILIGGEPGIGKSTLLLQISTNISAIPKYGKVMYISGEEAINQIQMRARRLKVEKSDLLLVNGSQLEEILTTLKQEKPQLIIIDSIQTLWSDVIPSSPGTISQLRHCSAALTFYAKQNQAILILIGHVTKDGQIAGPKVIEHMVDTVLYFEQNNHDQLRLLRAIKNRFGSANEIGIFEMEKEGLKPVSNPSEIFLANHNQETSGSAIFPGIQGSRPVLIEMQSLITSSTLANPRRTVVGWDGGRLSMILAILEMRADVIFGHQDIYVSTAGGVKISDPAADLAVAAALISAHFNKIIPKEYVFFGEIGLSGSIKNVQYPILRQDESFKLGFKKIIRPLSNNKKNHKENINLIKLSHVSDLVSLINTF